MSYRLLALPLFSIPFITLPSYAYSSTELETMVVTASRIEPQQNLAASITIISSEDIKRSPSRTLPELLSQETGVTLTSLFSHGSRANVGLRGFGPTATQNTLILLDGRRLNDIDLTSVNFSAIPFENIDHIEIVRGSGAVLYGDGATGGVINIVTKDPRDSDNYSTLSATTGSFDQREVNAFTSYSNDSFSISANVNSSKSDGYREHNSFDQDSGQLDIRLPLSRGEIYWKLGGFKQDIELPGTRTVNPTIAQNELSNRKGTTTPNDWANERTKYTTLGYSIPLNNNDSFIIDAGYRQKVQKSQFDYGVFFGTHYGDYAETSIRTLSLTPRLMMTRNLSDHQIDLILGADIYHYNYSSDRSNFASNIGQPIHKLNVDQNSLAFYSQGTISLSEYTSLTAGWRLQRVSQKANDQYDGTAPGGTFGSEAVDYDDSDTENSFELGLKQFITESWDAYGRVSRSVRFGTVDELYESNSFSKLKPQIADGIEFGLNFHNQWLQSSISVFHQAIEDEIHFNPTSFENINLDDTQHQGVELSLEAQINPSLTLKGAYTYLDAEFTSGPNDGNELTLIPNHTYTMSALAVLPAGFNGALNWNYVSEKLFENDMTNTFTDKIPSYQTVDLKVSKKISKLELTLQANNIFNEKYYNYGVSSTATVGKFNAYSMPERTVYFSASYQFD